MKKYDKRIVLKAWEIFKQYKTEALMETYKAKDRVDSKRFLALQYLSSGMPATKESNKLFNSTVAAIKELDKIIEVLVYASNTEL